MGTTLRYEPTFFDRQCLYGEKNNAANATVPQPMLNLLRSKTRRKSGEKSKRCEKISGDGSGGNNIDEYSKRFHL